MFKKLHDIKKAVRIPFTKEGYEAAQKKHDELRERRKVVLVELQRAREMGDLSENGAYKAARWELGGIDRQIRHLTYQLRAGKVVRSKGDGQVDFGCTVVVRIGETERTFMIVNGYESDPRVGKLSALSPMAKALMGHVAGDTVEFEGPEGKKQAIVLLSVTS